jgi:hypothetical protein
MPLAISMDNPQAMRPIEEETAAGYPSHSLISGSLSPPFFKVNRRTI